MHCLFLAKLIQRPLPLKSSQLCWALLSSGYKLVTVDVAAFLSHGHHFQNPWPWRIKGHLNAVTDLSLGLVRYLPVDHCTQHRELSLRDTAALPAH